MVQRLARIKTTLVPSPSSKVWNGVCVVGLSVRANKRTNKVARYVPRADAVAGITDVQVAVTATFVHGQGRHPMSPTSLS